MRTSVFLVPRMQFNMAVTTALVFEQALTKITLERHLVTVALHKIRTISQVSKLSWVNQVI